MAGRGVMATVAVVGLLAVAAACGGSDDSDEGTTEGTMAPTTTTAAAPTTPEPGTIAPPVTSVATTVAAPTTSAAPTTTATTTTEPLPVRELVLSDSGIGSAAFGADPDAVVEYVGSLLGAPTEDTGWVDPLSFALCEGTEARRVSWGALSLLFGDLSTFSSGRRHFFGWEYGLDGQLGLEPQGLRTDGGLTLGSPVVELRAQYEDVFLNEGDGGSFPSSFYVSDEFRGLLTGVTDDDLVTVMFGGFGCGG